MLNGGFELVHELHQCLRWNLWEIMPQHVKKWTNPTDGGFQDVPGVK